MEEETFRYNAGSRAGIRTPVTGAKAPHPGPLDDPASKMEYFTEEI